MARRLTERFPWLLPLRQKQRRFCYYLHMRFDGISYAARQTGTPLPYLAFESRCPMYNHETGFPMAYQENKVHNLKLAAKPIDGLLIHPGETFSFWNRVHGADREIPYKEALTERNGTLTVDYGGGLCQLSNLLCWLSLHTSLTVAERHGHRKKDFPEPPSDAPLGVDATVAEGWLDFRVRNDTEAVFQLSADDWRDPESRAFTGTQAARLQSLLEQLHRRGLFPEAHLLDSCGLLHASQYGGSYARIGIALYGVSDGSPDLPLRPVLSLKARIALVRTVPAGESVGYGLDGKSDRDRRIAVVTIGYADGVPRNLSCGRGNILVHGKPAPIVGRICMDQMMVDVSEIPEAKPGDTAVLIGTSYGRTVTARELAEAAGTIPNELLSRLGPRLERIGNN